MYLYYIKFCAKNQPVTANFSQKTKISSVFRKIIRFTVNPLTKFAFFSIINAANKKTC